MLTRGVRLAFPRLRVGCVSWIIAVYLFDVIVIRRDDLPASIANILKENYKVFSRAFKYHNYRLYFSGQMISVIGTWIQRIAMSWLIYRITGSAWLLGIVGFTSQIPSLILSPVVGVIADRQNRLQLIIITQCLAMLQAFVVAALTISNTIQVWHIISLSLFLGVVSAFDMPTRQAFVQDMIEKKEDLSNAIAMNSLLFNGARLIGPMIAGILVATVGEGICFLLNGLSYIAVIIALFMIRVKKREKPVTQRRFMDDFIDGARYSFGFIPIRYILINMSIIGFFGLPYITLMPIFARDILQGGPKTYGFLMASVGIGALISGSIFAMRRSLRGIGTAIAVSCTVFSIGIILFSLSPVLWLSMIFLVILGFGQITTFASSNTSLQTMADENMRGRVLAFYHAAIMGIAPFGNLIAGAAAEKIGAPNTLLIGGIVCLLGAFHFYLNIPRLRKIVRPIFMQMGVEYPEQRSV